MSVSSDGQLAASVSNMDDGLVLWDLVACHPVTKIQGKKLSEVREDLVFFAMFR